MSLVVKTTLFFVTIIGWDIHNAAALGNAIVHKEGDPCQLKEKPGKWSDVSQCSVGKDYVQISEKILTLIEDLDILVCCELSDTLDECTSSGDSHFEFTRMDNSKYGWSPHIVMAESCALSSNRKVGKLLANSSLGESTDYHNTSDAYKNTQGSEFLVELFDNNKVTLDYYVGVLLSENFVLTLGQCLKLRAPSFVKIGTRNESAFIAVAQLITYSQYEWPHNDIGLIRLQDFVILSSYIRPVCLPETDELIEGSTQKVVAIQDKQSIRFSGNVTIVQWEECLSILSNVDAAKNFCATRTVTNPCHLKQGFPLFDERTTASSCTSTVIGLKSHGIGCNKYVFTRIFPHVGWIKRMVWN